MDDRDALLESLKIDREAKSEQPVARRGLWLALAVLMILGSGAALAFFGLRGSDAGNVAQTSSIPASETAPIQTAQAPTSPSLTRPSDRVLNASGYIVARRRATVSAEISGRVQELLFEEGDVVEAGTVLARLDGALVKADLDLSQARVAVSQATVRAAEANYNEAQRVLKRTRSLSSNEFSSEADLTRAQADVEARTADLARARADLRVAELEVVRQRERLDDFTVRAPFAGVVIDKNAQPGEIIFPGSAGGGFTRTGICTLVDMDSLEIEVDVNEAFINRVRSGQRVRAQLDAYPDWDIKAAVIAIVPTANRDKATVRVRIGLEEKDPRILPDMGVKVAFLES